MLKLKMTTIFGIFCFFIGISKATGHDQSINSDLELFRHNLSSMVKPMVRDIFKTLDDSQLKSEFAADYKEKITCYMHWLVCDNENLCTKNTFLDLNEGALYPFAPGERLAELLDEKREVLHDLLLSFISKRDPLRDICKASPILDSSYAPVTLDGVLNKGLFAVGEVEKVLAQIADSSQSKTGLAQAEQTPLEGKEQNPSKQDRRRVAKNARAEQNRLDDEAIEQARVQSWWDTQRMYSSCDMWFSELKVRQREGGRAPETALLEWLLTSSFLSLIHDTYKTTYSARIGKFIDTFKSDHPAVEDILYVYQEKLERLRGMLTKHRWQKNVVEIEKALNQLAVLCLRAYDKQARSYLGHRYTPHGIEFWLFDDFDAPGRIKYFFLSFANQIDWVLMYGICHDLKFRVLKDGPSTCDRSEFTSLLSSLKPKPYQVYFILKENYIDRPRLQLNEAGKILFEHFINRMATAVEQIPLEFEIKQLEYCD